VADVLLCPVCRGRLAPGEPCCAEGHRFAVKDGVLALLTPDFAAELRAFNEVLRDYRDRIGRRLLDESVYDSLPHGLAQDFEWRLRCFDLEVLQPLLPSRPASILDVGSYNGWLARHLADAGHDVTAVDYFDDPHDGLGARRFHARAAWRSIQLDLRDLSVLGRTYDAVVLNRCLQFFADPVAYLEHARERVAAGGLLIATGLDFHRDPRRKRRHVERLSADYRRRYGRDFFLRPTRGYLDFRDRERLRSAGLDIRPMPPLWRANLLARVLVHRPRFCYGVSLG
jgi:SAM-dependent methyltransferase